MINVIYRCDCGSEDVRGIVRETKGTIAHYFKCFSCEYFDDVIKLETTNGKIK